MSAYILFRLIGAAATVLCFGLFVAATKVVSLLARKVARPRKAVGRPAHA